MIAAFAGILGAGALLLGLALASIGLYGMFRKPVIFDQLHAAGLVTGPGVILVLVAALATGSAEIASSAILVIAFILVTSSLSAHAIALAAWRSDASTVRAPRAVGAAGAADAARAGPGPELVPGAMLATRVLLAHDGTPGAHVATSLVASLPWAAGSHIRVIGAIEGDFQPFDPDPPASARRRPAVELTGDLEAAIGALSRPGVTADHVVRPGDPAAAIATEAEDFGAQLVVIGSRGLGPVRALFVGSVAAAVVDAAPCPVLVARTPAIRGVLVATDGAGPSELAVDAVARWPFLDALPMHVLCVATASLPTGDPSTDGTSGEAQARSGQEIVEAAATRLRAAGRQVEASVRTGDPTAAILEFARAEPVDLIVLGSRGRTGLRRALLGSVARDVLAAAEVSVLVVNADR